MARNFPEEVITEILSWLPVKSLMRLKCISKPWLHLISTDPHFMKLHFSRSIHVTDVDALNSNLGYLVSRKERIPKTEFYYSEDYTECYDELTRFQIPFSNSLHPSYISLDGICHDFTVVNVCNGLVCLTDHHQKDHSNTYVWNPLTRDHITLPSPPIPSCFSGRTEGGILYDIMFGFGFNQANDEYKLIRFVSTSTYNLIDKCRTHVSVYTLGTGSSWRTLQQFLPYSITHSSNSSTALVNGALHWFGSKLNDSVWWDSRQPNILIAFNMQDEIFQEIPQPVGMTYDYPFNNSIGELGGFLCIFRRLKGQYLEILVMVEYGVADSWGRLCKIGQPQVSGRYDYLTPLGVADNGEIIISKTPWEWISYDPGTSSVKDLRSFDFQVFDAHTFDGSLLSPSIINGASTASSLMIE